MCDLMSNCAYLMSIVAMRDTVHRSVVTFVWRLARQHQFSPTSLQRAAAEYEQPNWGLKILKEVVYTLTDLVEEINAETTQYF